MFTKRLIQHRPATEPIDVLTRRGKRFFFLYFQCLLPLFSTNFFLLGVNNKRTSDVWTSRAKSKARLRRCARRPFMLETMRCRRGQAGVHRTGGGIFEFKTLWEEAINVSRDLMRWFECFCFMWSHLGQAGMMSSWVWIEKPTRSCYVTILTSLKLEPLQLNSKATSRLVLDGINLRSSQKYLRK